MIKLKHYTKSKKRKIKTKPEICIICILFKDHPIQNIFFSLNYTTYHYEKNNTTKIRSLIMRLCAYRVRCDGNHV
jgi:hypothetical protein